MNNNKNSHFLFVFAGLFLLAAIIGACSGATGGSNNRNGSSPRANSNQGAQQSNYATAPAGASPAHFKGGQAAKVVIEEFADYQCPTCATMHPIVQQLQAAYGDRVKIIFRNYPLTQIHPKAYDAAVAAESAGLQGKFWEMQNQLFTNQQFWSTASDHRKTFEDYAQKIGLDVEKFRNDMAGIAAKDRVDKDLQRAKGLSVGSTPTFYINGRQLSFEETKEFNLFRQVVEAELQKTQSSSSGTQSAPATANTTSGGTNTTAGNANTATK